MKSSNLTALAILKELHAIASPATAAGKSRWNITAAQVIGVSIPDLRRMAKKIGKNHALALELWDSGINEVRILCSMIDDPSLVSSTQMDSWAADFDSWDVCDQVCSNLFDKTKYPYKKIVQWSKDKREFVRRSAFTLMAALAVHDKKAEDAAFISFFPLIEKYADDDRNFVKKAVNWALRQIGKRNATLHLLAMKCAKRLIDREEPSARWIGRDALRELQSDVVCKRVGVSP